MPIDEQLKHYIETVVLPRYDAFDHGHDRSHAERVIAESIELAQNYGVDLNKAYVVAAYHDVGMERGRDLHHIYSGEALMNDQKLRRWFSETDLCEMRAAVEDHRASGNEPPRNIYGCIVAEADRDIDPVRILRRTVQFGLEHFPDESRDFHLQRDIEHLRTKYAEGGYLKLWLHSPKNERGLSELRSIIADEVALRRRLGTLIDEEMTQRHLE